MENLRNDTLLLFGRIRVPKFQVLRYLFTDDDNILQDQIFDQETGRRNSITSSSRHEVLLNAQIPRNTLYFEQLKKFYSIQQQVKKQRNRVDISLYPPGSI